MRIFKEKKPKGITVIVGCGRLGSNIANSISDDGNDVIVIDKNRDAFRRLSSGFGGYTIVGDCTDLSVLEEAELKKADVLVAVTNEDSVNIMVSELAKGHYGVKDVVTRIYDPERSCALKDSGIQMVCPSLLTATAIETILMKKTEN